jgi:MFS family permease
MQWVVNAYTLCMSALLLIGGATADQFGRRRVFLIGVAVFAVASLGSGLAPTARRSLRRARCRVSARRCSCRARWR